MPDVMNVAVFGLGSMGFGIAESLIRAGHPTYGFDPVAEQRDRLVTVGGVSADIDDIVDILNAVVVVVLNAEQTQSVLFGSDTASGVVPKLKRGSTVMSCATIPPLVAQSLAAQCESYGVHYLDAPISGGAMKASQGALSIMASGTADAFNAARPV